MIVSLNNSVSNRNVDNVTTGVTSYSTASKTIQMEQSGFQLGIADKVMDDEAYGSQGKTMEAVMQQAQLEDVTVQKNFMTVMSNSVSGEDLKKMQEDGYSAGSTDVDTYVDIVDKIKVTLAKAGVVIAGYNDDIPQDTVAEITGSVSEAKEICDSFTGHQVSITEENVKAAVEAIRQAMQLQGFSDGMLQYMVKNQIAPTIENTYLAQFSATENSHQAQGYFSDGAGYYAKKAQQPDWTQIADQIEQICTQAGVDKNQEEEWKCAIENSKWLVEQGIPLTVEHLEALSTLKEINLPKSFEEITQLVAAALENGKKPQEANLAGEENIYLQAEEIVEDVLSITPEAVDKVVQEGKSINIKNLTAAQKQIIENRGNAEELQIPEENNSQTEEHQVENTDAGTYQATKAKRQLLEIQLMMTSQMNVKLLKSGYQLETKNLSQLVEDLKNLEASEQKILFKGETPEENIQKASLFTETLEKVNSMSSMPAAVIGKAVQTGETFTIGYVNREGSILKSTYQEAGVTYEALMTTPRKDMGDSIQKAFQNVDEILKDMNLDITKQNQRAVRILSYNQMEITTENIQSVKDADLSVQNVMRKMTPGATLQMIRDGVNPLETSMQELDDYLTGQNQSGEKQAEKYAEYLYKLEQKNEITKEEKEAYIGIYRLFRQIEKSDGAVIGSLVGAQAEINMKNLLSAVRSNKAKGINISVDDKFGSLQNIVENGTRISDQIMEGYTDSKQQNSESKQQNQQTNYYTKLAESIFETISPDKIEKSHLIEGDQIQNLNLEELAEQMQQVEEEVTASEYYESVLEECKQLNEVSETVVQSLLDEKIPVTMDNLLAANTVMTKRGSLFSALGRMAEEETDDATEEDSPNLSKALFYQETVSDLKDQFQSKESARTAYSNMISAAKDLLEGAISKSDVKAIDVKAAGLLYKQLSYVALAAKEENYEIPVTIDGEITSVNLRIIHDNQEKGKVSVTMQTDSFGQVGAEFEVTKDRIQGFIACDHTESLPTLDLLKNMLQETLPVKEEQKAQIQVVSTNTLDIQKFADSRTNRNEKEEENVSTNDLYRISMKFIESLERIGKVV